MSDFMKSVVTEALRGKRNSTTIKENKIHMTTSSPRVTNHSSSHDSLESIIRPNYQSKNVEKRLSILNEKNEAKGANSPRNNHPEETKTPKSLPSISELRKVSLSGGMTRMEQTSGYSSPKQDKAQQIGATKDGSSVWFFPTVHPNLASMFHRTTAGYSVIIVHSNTCYPSQLLLLNELLFAYPELKYHLIWNKTNNQPFALELYDTNSGRLEKIAKDIFQQFSKRSLKSIETFQVNSPSAWLSKQLGLINSVETVGFVEGISFYNSLLLFDHYLKDGHDTTVSLQLEENYLWITGKSTQISEALLILKKLADRL